jgi:hypothetical protein
MFTTTRAARSALALAGVSLGFGLPLALGCGARTSLTDGIPSEAGAQSDDGMDGTASGGGACADTQNDRENCGACGVKCSGTCAMGRCTVTLASGLTSAGCVAVDAGNVYWVIGSTGPRFEGAVMKTPREGGAVTTLASGEGFPWPCHIALDETSVYWGGQSADTVRKVSQNGGSITTLASGQPATGGLAVDATSVYWTGGYAGVMKMARGGGAPVLLATQGGEGLAIDSHDVYWTSRSGQHDGGVLRVPLDGGAVSTLASVPDLPEAIALDAVNVYTAGYSDGTLLAIPLGGGPITTLASDQTNPSVITLDESNIYWTGSTGLLTRVPKSGGTSTLLASDSHIFSVALDESSVYWTNGSAVMKLTPK